MGRLKRYGNLTSTANYQLVKPKAVIVGEYGLTTVELESDGYKKIIGY